MAVIGPPHFLAAGETVSRAVTGSGTVAPRKSTSGIVPLLRGPVNSSIGAM